MQILENSCSCNVEVKRRGLSWGVTKEGKEQYRELVKSLNFWFRRSFTNQMVLNIREVKDSTTLVNGNSQKP